MALLAVVGLVAGYTLKASPAQQGTSTSSSGQCVKPPNGILIIASETGFNDSVDHGVPEKAWPVANVSEGSTVDIVVCNLDHIAHGFNIQHYYETPIQTLSPGQVLRISFVADKAGTFWIRCEIFCPIHPFMQSGELRVT
jgi:hypothetical protein